MNMKTKELISWGLVLFSTLLFLGCNNDDNFTINHPFIGLHKTDANKYNLVSVDIAAGSSKDIYELNNDDLPLYGDYTYDHNHDYYIFATIQKLKVVDVKTNTIVITFEGIRDAEYNKNDGKIYGMDYDNENNICFVSADIKTRAITQIKKLTGIETTTQGTSTFNFIDNQYVVVVGTSDNLKILQINILYF